MNTKSNELPDPVRERLYNQPMVTLFFSEDHILVSRGAKSIDQVIAQLDKAYEEAESDRFEGSMEGANVTWHMRHDNPAFDDEWAEETLDINSSAGLPNWRQVRLLIHSDGPGAYRVYTSQREWERNQPRAEYLMSLTVPQVAAKLSVDVSRVRALCAGGRIGRMVGRQWLISSAEVARVRDELSQDTRSPLFSPSSEGG